MFLEKLAKTTVSMIKSSEFLDDGDVFHSASIAEGAPNRRSSLNLIPLNRTESEFTFDSEEAKHSEEVIAEEAPTHRLIQMPDSLEEIIELMFMEFACMTHSREGLQVREDKDSAFLLSETYMTKRNFLAMCLVLDIIDTKLTLVAARSCFEKYAFLSERGQRKFNNRYISCFLVCVKE